MYLAVVIQEQVSRCGNWKYMGINLRGIKLRIGGGFIVRRVQALISVSIPILGNIPFFTC